MKTRHSFFYLTLLFMVMPVQAHHSVQAQFDVTKSIVLKGVVSKVDWINPHTYIYMDVPDNAGNTVAWAFETLGPSALRRAGLRSKDVFKVGTTYTFTARPSRNGTHTALLKLVEFPDGTKVALGAGVPGELVTPN